MTMIDVTILIISALGFIILIIFMSRDKNEPIGYKFTDPEDLPSDNDEDDNLDKK